MQGLREEGGAWLGCISQRAGSRSNICSDASMSDAGYPESSPPGRFNGGDPQVSECTRKNVEAAKTYIENMYRSQAQSVINRKERCVPGPRTPSPFPSLTHPEPRPGGRADG